MIIKIECTQEERQAIKAMAQKTVVMQTIKTAHKVITPKGDNTVEIKPALVIAGAKLVEAAAPLLTSLLGAIKAALEVLRPYIEAVEEAAEEEG